MTGVMPCRAERNNQQTIWLQQGKTASITLHRMNIAISANRRTYAGKRARIEAGIYDQIILFVCPVYEIAGVITVNMDLVGLVGGVSVHANPHDGRVDLNAI